MIIDINETKKRVRQRTNEAYAAPASPGARRLACLLGGAIGDALGYRVEFQRWHEIERQYGPAGIRLADCKGPLVVSDDTQMTLFTLEGMTRAARVEDIVPETREAYLDWLQTQGYCSERSLRGSLATVQALRQPRAPGNTCLSALRKGGGGAVESPINDSKGSGGVMRTAPLGFLYGAIGDAAVFRLGAQCAALTHGHPDGYLPAGAMALFVRDALNDVPWEASVHRVLAEVAHWPASRTTSEAVRAALVAASDGAPSRARLGTLGEGWVAEEALAVGLYAAMASRSFAECIELAANHDGDSDSTASIAGQLWGAKVGLAGIARDVSERVDAIEAVVQLWAAWEDRPRIPIDVSGGLMQ